MYFSEIFDQYERIALAAEDGILLSQVKCYGLCKLFQSSASLFTCKYSFSVAYPDNCVTYYGPHTTECLETMWYAVNCLQEGTKHISKLTNEEIQILDHMDLK